MIVVTRYPNCPCCGGGSGGGGSGSGQSGSGLVTGCSACPDGAARQFAFSLSGITNIGCTDCPTLNGTWTVINPPPLSPFGVGCVWQSVQHFVCDDLNFYGTLQLTGTIASLDVASLATYQGDTAGWDCKSPLTLVLMYVGPGLCNNWPATVTLVPV